MPQSLCFPKSLDLNELLSPLFWNGRSFFLDEFSLIDDLCLVWCSCSEANALVPCCWSHTSLSWSVYVQLFCEVHAALDSVQLVPVSLYRCCMSCGIRAADSVIGRHRGIIKLHNHTERGLQWTVIQVVQNTIEVTVQSVKKLIAYEVYYIYIYIYIYK